MKDLGGERNRVSYLESAASGLLFEYLSWYA